MPAQVSVNLLPKDPFLDSIVGKFLLWSLQIGRYLVVFTELVVILSFLSRFKLDRDLTDLNEKITVQKQTILSYGDTEAKFNAAKSKIETIKLIQDSQLGLNTLTFLEQNLPIDVKLNRLTSSVNGWTIDASTLSAQSLRAIAEKIFAANPSATISFSKIKLNSRTGAIDFSLSVVYKSTTSAVNPSSKTSSSDI